MRLPKSVITGLVVLLCVVLVGVGKALLLRKPENATKLPSVVKARVKGDRQAAVQVVEFTDFQCPACAKAAEVIKEVFDEYPGQVFLELKYFPLAMHSFARRASIYSECVAEQGKFWAFHDVLYKSQSSWSKMAAVDEYFSQLAVSLGVDGMRLSTCVNVGLVDKKIDQDVLEGTGLGVKSTPSFFVNGKLVVGGANFRAAVKEILGGAHVEP